MLSLEIINNSNRLTELLVRANLNNKKMSLTEAKTFKMKKFRPAMDTIKVILEYPTILILILHVLAG